MSSARMVSPMRTALPRASRAGRGARERRGGERGARGVRDARPAAAPGGGEPHEGARRVVAPLVVVREKVDEFLEPVGVQDQDRARDLAMPPPALRKELRL